MSARFTICENAYEENPNGKKQMNKYPLTLQAVKANQKSQWDIGDALIKECDPPSQVGINDGSFKKLQEAAQYLLDQGYEYAVNSLSEMRQISYSFESPQRRSLAWGVHRAARTPEFLNAVVAGAPKGTRITQDYIEGIRQRQADKERRDREEEEAKARKEREKAEEEEAKVQAKAKAAKDKEEKKKAKEEVAKAKAKTKKAKQKERETKNAPRKKTGPPPKDEIPVMAIESKFISEAAHCVTIARQNIKRIKEIKDELTPKGIAALTEAALEAANAWTEAARIVRSELANDSGHLSIVGE